MSLIDQTKRDEEYEDFYTIYGITKEKVLENTDSLGYLCVCVFCQQNEVKEKEDKENFCRETCHETGVPCDHFVEKVAIIDKFK